MAQAFVWISISRCHQHKLGQILYLHLGTSSRYIRNLLLDTYHSVLLLCLLFIQYTTTYLRSKYLINYSHRATHTHTHTHSHTLINNAHTSSFRLVYEMVRLDANPVRLTPGGVCRCRSDPSIWENTERPHHFPSPISHDTDGRVSE